MVHWIVTCWYDNPSLSWWNIVWPCLPWYNQVNQLLVCQAVIAMVWKYYCLDTCWHNAFYTVQLLHMLLWQLWCTILLLCYRSTGICYHNGTTNCWHPALSLSCRNITMVHMDYHSNVPTMDHGTTAANGNQFKHIFCYAIPSYRCNHLLSVVMLFTYLINK